jgi:hypothetical protein
VFYFQKSGTFSPLSVQSTIWNMATWISNILSQSWNTWCVTKLANYMLYTVVPRITRINRWSIRYLHNQIPQNLARKTLSHSHITLPWKIIQYHVNQIYMLKYAYDCKDRYNKRIIVVMSFVCLCFSSWESWAFKERQSCIFTYNFDSYDNGALSHSHITLPWKIIQYHVNQIYMLKYAYDTA